MVTAELLKIFLCNSNNNNTMQKYQQDVSWIHNSKPASYVNIMHVFLKQMKLLITSLHIFIPQKEVLFVDNQRMTQDIRFNYIRCVPNLISFVQTIEYISGRPLVDRELPVARVNILSCSQDWYFHLINSPKNIIHNDKHNSKINS